MHDDTFLPEEANISSDNISSELRALMAKYVLVKFCASFWH